MPQIALLMLVTVLGAPPTRSVNANVALTRSLRMSARMDADALKTDVWRKLGDVTALFRGRTSPVFTGTASDAAIGDYAGFASVEIVKVIHEFDYDTWLAGQDKKFRAKFRTAMTGPQRRAAVSAGIKRWKTSTEFPWYEIRLIGQADWLSNATEGRPYDFAATLKTIDVVYETIGKYKNPLDDGSLRSKQHQQPRLILTMQLMNVPQPSQKDVRSANARPRSAVTGKTVRAKPPTIRVRKKRPPPPKPPVPRPPPPEKTLAQTFENWIYSFDSFEWIGGFIAVAAFFVAYKAIKSQTG